jgi:hypothetical protein
MASRLRWFLVLLSCGGQTSPPPPPDAAHEEDAASSAIVLPCTAGGPAVTLVNGADLGLPSSLVFNGLATDGSRLYIAQSLAPLLWSTGMLGGAMLPLYGADATSYQYIGFGPLLPSGGGIYFDAIVEPTHGLKWISGLGGAVMNIAPASVGMYDWSGERGFAASGGVGNWTIDTVALPSGAEALFATVGPELDAEPFLVTQRFMHVIYYQPPNGGYRDRRLNLTDASVHDDIDIAVGNSEVIMGPTAVCGIAGGGRSGMSCLFDDASAPTYLPIGSSPVYLDASWVYTTLDAAQQPALERVSLLDGHGETLMSGVYPGAVATYGACIYAAVTPLDPFPKPPVIWRFSP